MSQNRLNEQRPILFVGDMHIGRRPESLAELLDSLDVSTRDLSPEAAWKRTVEHAITVDARAVVLAGDVVDREQDLLEAYGAVERGARDLERAGIPLIAIAGNHDAELLPRLAENVESVHLLGAKATWERYTIDDGERPVTLFGWSFPSPHYSERPLNDPRLAELLASPRDGTRILTIHGDLDVPASRYAPINGETLRALPVDAVFLGHIHKPDPLDGVRPCGYLGSLVGLDAGELGEHGPVEVRIAEDGRVVTERIPLAPLRWERIVVDVSAANPWQPETLKRHIQDTVNDWLGEQPSTLRATVLAARINLVGRRPTESWRTTFHELQVGRGRSFLPEAGRTEVILERFIDETLPAIDLLAIAQELTPPGRLARFLLEEVEVGVLQDAERVWASAWADETLPPPDDVPVRARLKQAAQRTLERMLAERRAGDSL